MVLGRLVLRLGVFVTLWGVVPVHAQTFSLQVGPAVAAMPDPAAPRIEKKVGKDLVFVVRPNGCERPEEVAYTGTAVGPDAGVRHTWTLPIGVVTTSGVVGAVRNWTGKAPWVAVIAAACGQQQAGALVRIVNDAYRRDAVELLPRRPTAADIDRAYALLLQEQAASPSR